MDMSFEFCSLGCVMAFWFVQVALVRFTLTHLGWFLAVHVVLGCLEFVPNVFVFKIVLVCLWVVWNFVGAVFSSCNYSFVRKCFSLLYFLGGCVCFFLDCGCFGLYHVVFSLYL